MSFVKRVVPMLDGELCKSPVLLLLLLSFEPPGPVMKRCDVIQAAVIVSK